MRTRHIKTGHARRVKLTAAASGATVLSAVVAATLFQPSIAAAIQDGKGLAELAGRSPGKRIGGIALKGKKPKAAPVRTAKPKKPRGSQAEVLANMTLPEGPVPGFLPAEEMPSDFAAPPVPIEALEQVADFTGGPSFPGSGVLFFGPFPGPTGPGIGVGVPEPATWLTLIAGFGLLGGQMRRKRAGAIASA